MDVIGQTLAISLGVCRRFSEARSQGKADTLSASFAFHAISISLRHLKFLLFFP